MPRGRPRTKPEARCPEPEHRGSTTYAGGEYATKNGRRQRYRCVPLVGKKHSFTVVLAEKVEPRDRHAEPPPSCPRNHTGTVYLNGFYGTRTAEPRQRYRCIPSEHDLDEEGKRLPRHNFALELPRDHIHAGNQDCKECAELRGVHRGETAVARGHSWSTRIVVRALEKLAAGETYSGVSQWALRVEGRGKRVRRTPAEMKVAKAALERGEEPPKVERDPNDEARKGGKRWHIAADWCEAFSPIVWQDQVEQMTSAAQQARDAGASIVWLVDSTTFGSRRRVGGGRNGGTTGERFALLSIAEQFVSADGVPGPAQLRLARALPNRTAQAWQLVLSEPGYAPDFVVTDADAGQWSAVAAQFPQVVLIPCLFHLRRSLREGLAELPSALTGPKHDRQLHPDLREHLGKMTGRADIHDANQIAAWWDRWTELHRKLDIPTDRLARQRDRYEGVLAASAADLGNQPNLPLSVGALESMQNHCLRPTFTRRAAGFGNIERTNALLDLIVAGQRHAFDDLNRIADLLRADAAGDENTEKPSHGGFTTPLRWVEDPQPKRDRYSSLHDPGLVTDLAEQRGIL